MTKNPSSPPHLSLSLRHSRSSTKSSQKPPTPKHLKSLQPGQEYSGITPPLSPGNLNLSPGNMRPSRTMPELYRAAEEESTEGEGKETSSPGENTAPSSGSEQSLQLRETTLQNSTIPLTHTHTHTRTHPIMHPPSTHITTQTDTHTPLQVHSTVLYHN